MTRTTLSYLCALIILFTLFGCRQEAAPATAPAATTGPTSAAPTTIVQAPTRVAAPTSTVAAPSPTPGSTDTRQLTIFYTNDEHGWMAGMEEGQGAANLAGLWQEAAAAEETLILSGGDMWTGPAISTWFEGEGMVEVMNEMGYAAAAIGNHEFDFGLEALQARAFEADFPFLSANVRPVAGADLPRGLAIRPYTIVERNGVQVGIVGLTTTSTPVTTNPTNVAAFDFLGYEVALREAIPAARAEGADIVVVAGHLCRDELQRLARAVSDLEIALIGGGHCNELFATEVAGTILLEGGYHFTSYAMAALAVNTETDTVVSASYDTVANAAGSATDPAVAAIVAEWQARAQEELEVVIGYLEQALPRRSDELEQLVVESWLWAYPQADVALTNRGGFRADLPAGEVTFADVVGVLPFNNVLVDVQLSGQELLQVLAHGSGAVGGARLGVGEWILEESGEAVDPAGTYHLLVNDFMYAGGDDYTMLARFDPDAYNTAIDWRQPVIDWILAQESSAAAPLDPAVEALAD